jgi:hypothetical protein
VTPLHSAALGFAAANLSAAKQLAADVNMGLTELMNELESFEAESNSSTLSSDSDESSFVLYLFVCFSSGAILTAMHGCPE